MSYTIQYEDIDLYGCVTVTTEQTTINTQSTQDSLLTSFMGYTVQYKTIDLYSCLSVSTIVISDETSIVYLTSAGYMTTTKQTTINTQSTQDSLLTSFMGYTVQYKTIDLYSCLSVSTIVISDETSIVYLTSAGYMTTTKQTTINIQSATAVGLVF